MRVFNKIFRDRQLLQEMLTKRDNGWSATALELEFGCKGGAIIYRCKQHGVKPKKINFGKREWIALNNIERIDKIKTLNKEKVISDSVRNYKEDRKNEDGERINVGHSYKEYLKEDKERKRYEKKSIK